MNDTLLIIEDEAMLAQELERHFQREGWETVHAQNLKEAKRLLGEHGVEPLLVLSDMSLPDGNALDLLESLRAQGHTGEWIFLTGYGSVPDSVRAMRLGAYDFLEKPADLERLDLVVASATRSARAQQRLSEHAARIGQRYAPEAFLGRSAAAEGIRVLLRKLSSVPFSSLIIEGETGTGKGLAARILHHSGPRAHAPLVELNCAALPRDLLESELFGHEAGAFTGAKARHRGLIEQARGGTLFLDEIGELDLDLQVKLLKAIEDHRIRRVGGETEIGVDFQVIAATNRSLEQQIEAGDFRADLYHRLSVFTLSLPALRERREDLRDLVPLFIQEFNAKSAKRVRDVPETVWKRLEQHDWPGNVRELRNVIERSVLFSDGPTLAGEWLNLRPLRAPSPAPDPHGLRLPLDGSLGLDDMERTIVQAALRKCGGNVTAAARLLKTTRETLRYRVGKYLRPSEQDGA